jgi:hypothetical protein
MDGLQYSDRFDIIDSILSYSCKKWNSEEINQLSSVLLVLLSYPRAEVRKYFYNIILRLFTESKSVPFLLEILLHTEVLLCLILHGLSDEQVTNFLGIFLIFLD